MTKLVDAEIQTTARGFELIKFTDAKGQECSLQQSSSTGGEMPEGASFIWLGVKDNRMCLSCSDAAALWPLIKRWCETGSLEDWE